MELRASGSVSNESRTGFCWHQCCYCLSLGGLCRGAPSSNQLTRTSSLTLHAKFAQLRLDSVNKLADEDMLRKVFEVCDMDGMSDGGGSCVHALILGR